MSSLYKEIWNECHKNFIQKRENIVHDNWLEDFNEVIEKSSKPIIDLGCGNGHNTLYLIQKGKTTISCDYSDFAIEKLRENIPETQAILFDMTDKFPFEDNSTEIIIADLSLHYFSEEVTKNIIEEIKRVLVPNGHFLFRVNSINDINNGAMQGEKIEEHFYFVKNITKRFFDEKDIRNFFKDWKIEYLNEEKMDRYENNKKLWKCSVKK